MSHRGLRDVILLSGLTGLALMAGCSSGNGTTSETGKKDVVATADPSPTTPPVRQLGAYPPPPDVPRHPRIAVETFTVSSASRRLREMDDVAADEAMTLLDQWGGFKMIERAQADQLFKEQGMAGVQAGEEAKQHKLHGVDYVLIGKITNLSIKREVTKGGFVFGPVDKRTTNTTITSTCGVVIRLVDPSNGETIASVNDDYDQVFSSQSGGMSIGNMGMDNDSEVNITDDDRGKILKMALDDAILKGIPKFEKVLKEFNAAPAAAAAQ